MSRQRYPSRDENHVKETASIKAFERCIPDKWLVRHVTERDYGVDCLVEIVVGDAVNGCLAAMQLKGTEALSWGEPDVNGTCRAIFSGTRVETVNYWMGLPVPVFLCVHEICTGKIYFADVKRQVRRRYLELKRQDSFGFELLSILELSADTGYLVLFGLYWAERVFEQFASALLDLLIHRHFYTDYILSGVGRDIFLEVEPDDLIHLIRLYRNCQVVTSYSGDKWNVTSIQELFKEDHRMFKDSCIWLHEHSRTKILLEIAPKFVQSLRNGVRLIHELEKDFWQSREPYLVFYAEKGEIFQLLNELETILKPIYENQ